MVRKKTCLNKDFFNIDRRIDKYTVLTPNPNGSSNSIEQNLPAKSKFRKVTLDRIDRMQRFKEQPATTSALKNPRNFRLICWVFYPIFLYIFSSLYESVTYLLYITLKNSRIFCPKIRKSSDFLNNFWDR